MAEAGIKAGNEIAKEIISMGIVSKYRMAREMGISETQLYNWLKDASSPNEKNYLRLKDYRLYVERLKKVPKFG